MCYGAVDEARTRDLHLGKVALYQLSYYRMDRADKAAPSFFAGAGDGNRTRVASLEGWSSAIELHPRKENGAVDEARTRDLHLGKVALYQLSYYRMSWVQEENRAGEETRTLTPKYQNLNLARLPFRHARTRHDILERQMGMTHWRFELQTP